MPKRLNETVLNPDTSDSNLTDFGENSYETTTDVSGKDHTVHIFVNSLNYSASYNIPPTSGGVIIYLKQTSGVDYDYVIEPLHFGVLPVWLKPQDPLPVKRGNGFGPKYSREVQQTQAKFFNCRKETISQAKTMWNSAKKTRCVVPAQGYFEWKKEKNDKIPYFVFLKDSPVIYFAGLYSHNYNYQQYEIVPKDMEYFSSFAIMTGPGTGKGTNDLSWLHTRKPIVLKPNSREWFAWLDPERQFDDDLLKTALNTDTNPAYDSISSYIVAKSIGNNTNKGPDVIKEEKKTQKSIGLFFLLPKKQPKEDSKEEKKQHEEDSKEEKKQPKEDFKKDDKYPKDEPKKEAESREDSKVDAKNESKLRVKQLKQEKNIHIKREHEQDQSIAKRVRQEHLGSEYAMGRHNEAYDEEEEPSDDE